MGLILAGSADFKTDLNNTQMFDPRLKATVKGIVDVAYGGENGLCQAIELSEELLTSVKFVREKNLVSKFFENIDMDTGMVVYGVQDTMKAFENSTLDVIVCFEGLEYLRVELLNKET